MSAPALGIDKDNTAARNRTNFVKALSYSDENITFPPGDYLIDNSGSYVIIHDFAGQLTMEPGARFVFTDNARRGLNFQGGSGAGFYGLSSKFQNLPPERISPEECIIFLNSTDTVVQGANIDGSAGAGLLFWECVRPSVSGATIRNTMADGLHFANCQDATAADVLTEDTGDDGLAFLNYADSADYAGGRATNITVRRSQGRGIYVGGQREVVVDGFAVEGSSVSGLHCDYDSFWVTRVPSNVRFANGTVTNGGRTDGQSGNRFGIYYEDVGSVAFDNIVVVSPAARGVSGRASNGAVTLSNVEVKDAPEEGFALTAKTLYLNGLIARGTGKAGFYVGSSGLVSYGTLQAINTSKTNALRRAFSFENNAWVEGTELYVIDDQSTPTGYKVTTFGNLSGRLGRIHDHVANDDVQVENHSGLTIL